VPGSHEAGNALAHAISLENQDDREAALDDVIQVMASNFLDPCWIEIERTVGQIGHLPLPMLDIWRRLARSPNGMSALAFRFGTLPIGFLARFAQELPFAWECVPFNAWRQSMVSLKVQCIECYGEQAGAIIFKAHMDSRIKDMTADHGSLDYLLGIASSTFIPESATQAQLLKLAVGPTANQRLFEGESSILMSLRRLHADDAWPTGFNSLLGQARSKPDIAHYLCPQQHSFADGVINMPLLLAAQVATNQSDQWFMDPTAVHTLRSHRAFDREWFDEAFNQTIARCLVDGFMA